MADTENNKNSNSPALRFHGFTDPWKPVTLGDVTFNFNRRNKECKEYPMYSVTNNRGFIPQNEQFEDREMVGEDIKSYKIIERGEFAYNPARINVGSIARYVGSEPCMISSLYVCFKPSNEVDGSFLLQFLKSPKANFYYNANGEGGVRIYLFYPNFARIRTAIPSLSEQCKISSFLKLLDERISTQRRLIDKLETLIKGVRDLFIRKTISDGKWVKLGDICHITTGKLDANAMEENGQYPFFTCAEKPFCINNYAFDTEALLISGNGANLGYINYYNGKFNAYQRTYVLDKFTEDIQFIKIALQMLLPKRIAIEKSTSNTPYIVQSTLSDMRIFIPSKDLQRRTTNLMLRLEEDMCVQTSLLASYNRMKSYLLQQMFI